MSERLNVLTAAAVATVRRRHGALLFSGDGSSELDAPSKSMAAVRAIDTHAHGIDVVFERAGIRADHS